MLFANTLFFLQPSLGIFWFLFYLHLDNEKNVAFMITINLWGCGMMYLTNTLEEICIGLTHS